MVVGQAQCHLEETLLMEQARGETCPEVPPHEQSPPICAYYLRWLTVITRALPQGVCGSVEPPRPCTLGIKRTTAQAFGLTIPSSRLEQADAVRCARKTDAGFAPTILARRFDTFRPAALHACDRTAGIVLQ